MFNDDTPIWNELCRELYGAKQDDPPALGERQVGELPVPERSEHPAKRRTRKKDHSHGAKSLKFEPDSRLHENRKPLYSKAQPVTASMGATPYRTNAG